LLHFIAGSQDFAKEIYEMQLRKKVFALLVTLALALALALPVVAATQPAAELASGAQVEGQVIRVGTDAAYPPFEEIDTEGNFVGFDIDLMEAIAEDSGFDIEWINAPFDTIFTNLALGDFDAVISASTITEEREEIVDFSDPYFVASQSISVRVEDAEEIATPEDLVGLRVGVQLGTTGEAYAQEIEGIELFSFDSTPLAFQALSQGDIDAVIADTPTSEEIIATNPDLNATVVGDPLTEEFYGIAVRPDFPELLEAINTSLANLITDGTYAEIYEDWFDVPPPEDFLPEEEGTAGTIFEVVGTLPNTTTIVAAAGLVPGLQDALSGEGPITVFIPSDEAFNNDQEAVGLMLSNLDLASRTLQYVVVPGLYTSEDLLEMDGQTLVSWEGTELTITIEDDTVLVNGVAVVEADIEASNGVIHIVDALILLPETLEALGRTGE
jgi:ABC-type amino acid transport substrate-binding protein/uncharacterized surface protein with fasciclin (FAS1) repeats